MDFYRRKQILNMNLVTFLREREQDGGPSWADFIRQQALSLGTTEKMAVAALEVIEPRLTIKDGELVKTADVQEELDG